MYTLGGTLALAGLVCLISGLRTGRRRWLAGYFVFTSLACYTHIAGSFLLPFEGLAILLYLVLAREVQQRRAGWGALLMIVGVGVVHAPYALNADGYNIYTVMNPIKLTFTGYAARDDDIAYRDLLLVDIDRAVKKVEPANDAEVEAARLIANAIKCCLTERGFSDPLRVMSGNGHHLYYVLKDVPNTPETTSTVQQVLHNLAAKFDNADVKVDTAVYNASRITKVPGTIMRKGMESAGRPYRMAVVYEE